MIHSIFSNRDPILEAAMKTEGVFLFFQSVGERLRHGIIEFQGVAPPLTHAAKLGSICAHLWAVRAPTIVLVALVVSISALLLPFPPCPRVKYLLRLIIGSETVLLCLAFRRC